MVRYVHDTGNSFHLSIMFSETCVLILFIHRLTSYAYIMNEETDFS